MRNPAPSGAERQEGECQICENRQRLRDGFLVLHGYRRPGYGHVEGDCPGTGALPYERSCELLKQYAAGLRREIPLARKRLHDLAGGAIVQITTFPKDARGQFLPPVDVTPPTGGKPDSSAQREAWLAWIGQRDAWDRALRNAIHAAKSRLGGLEAELARSDQRIAAWTLRPITIFTEAKREGEAKAARDARVSAKRDEQAAKLAQKQADRAKRRDKALADVRALLDRVRVILSADRVSMSDAIKAEDLYNKAEGRFSTYVDAVEAINLGERDWASKTGGIRPERVDRYSLYLSSVGPPDLEELARRWSADFSSVFRDPAYPLYRWRGRSD